MFRYQDFVGCAAKVISARSAHVFDNDQERNCLHVKKRVQRKENVKSAPFKEK